MDEWMDDPALPAVGPALCFRRSWLPVWVRSGSSPPSPSMSLHGEAKGCGTEQASVKTGQTLGQTQHKKGRAEVEVGCKAVCRGRRNSKLPAAYWSNWMQRKLLKLNVLLDTFYSAVTKHPISISKQYECCRIWYTLYEDRLFACGTKKLSDEEDEEESGSWMDWFWVWFSF